MMSIILFTVLQTVMKNPVGRELNRRYLKRVRVMAKWPFVIYTDGNCFESGIFSQILNNKPTLKNQHILCKKESHPVPGP